MDCLLDKAELHQQDPSDGVAFEGIRMPEAWSGERAIATSIVGLGFADLRAEGPKIEGMERETLAELAYVWFFEDEEVGGESFAWCCAVLGEDPDDARASLRSRDPQRLLELHRAVHHPLWCEWFNQRDVDQAWESLPWNYPAWRRRWLMAQRRARRARELAAAAAATQEG